MTDGSSSRPLAVVTGGSRGLGEVIAEFLAGAGYDLILIARRPGPLEAAATRLRRYGGNVDTVLGEVERPACRSQLRARVHDHGSLALLVNNASELGGSGLRALSGYPLEEWRHLLEVNLLAPLALVEDLLPFLQAAGGLVVNISSDAAVGAYPGWGAYGASKAALDLASRTLAVELASAGVSVVTVDPGDMRTAMHQSAYPGQDISDRPLPAATLPFWAWLFGQTPRSVNGTRFLAQAPRWELSA